MLSPPYYQWIGLISFIIGVVLLDLAVQGVHVTNQSTIYRILPDARNRLTAAYMTSYFYRGRPRLFIIGLRLSPPIWLDWCFQCAGAIIGLLGLLVWLFGYKNDPVIQSE